MFHPEIEGAPQLLRPARHRVGYADRREKVKKS